MTGAPLPSGADAVIRFEETIEQGSVVSLARQVAAGENVRPAGEDIRAGDVVVPAGTVLGAAAIGVLASIGQATASVRRRPRVAILSTGDELVDPSSTLAEGQIHDSNGPMLAALVRQAGAEPVPLGVARDRIDELRARLADSSGLDLIVTSGGVSVGDYDIVKDVLRRDGAIDIWQVRMKPGKPLAFGLLRGTPLLGLPGNPGAAYVSFLQFGYPAIRRMLGHASLELPTVDATLRGRIVNTGRRRHFVRGVIERSERGLEVRPTCGHGSGQLMPLVRSNCLIVVPEACEVVDVGATVRVQSLVNGPLI
jgi:molybdopterin molybdotransferase